MNDTRNERIGLLAIAGGVVIGLVLIARWAILNHIGSEAGTLIGVIAGGLIAFGKDIVAAIRGYSMSAQLSKVTDQLAASTPNGGAPAPKEAADAAQDTADAAQDTADRIKGDTA